MVIHDYSIQHLRETTFPFIRGLWVQYRRMDKVIGKSSKQHEKVKLSLTQLGVAKTEHTAICPVDHRLDHLCHGSSTHFSLADTRGDTKCESTVNNGNLHLLSWDSGSQSHGISRWVGSNAVLEVHRTLRTSHPLASLSITHIKCKPPGHIPRENRNSKGHMQPSVHCSSITIAKTWK